MPILRWPKLHRSLQKYCLLLISTETTTSRKSTVTLFDRSNPQLQNSVLQHSPCRGLRIFTIDKQEPARCARRNPHPQWWPTAVSQVLWWCHHPLLPSADTHCLGSRNVQQSQRMSARPPASASDVMGQHSEMEALLSEQLWFFQSSYFQVELQTAGSGGQNPVCLEEFQPPPLLLGLDPVLSPTSAALL